MRMYRGKYIREAFLLFLAVLTGCAEQKRSTFDLKTPRVYVWTTLDPQQVRSALQSEGLAVEESEKNSGLFVVRGTGTLKWPSVEISVGEDRVVANKVQLKSRPNSYRNLVIDNDGHVKPDAFLPFERRFPFP